MLKREVVFLIAYSLQQSVVILRERRVSSPVEVRSFQREAWRIKEVKDRLHDPRSVDRYLPNVANVTGNSLLSRFLDKVRSLRGSECAPLPLSRDVGAVALLNRVFASFRLSTRPNAARDFRLQSEGSYTKFL